MSKFFLAWIIIFITSLIGGASIYYGIEALGGRPINEPLFVTIPNYFEEYTLQYIAAFALPFATIVSLWPVTIGNKRQSIKLLQVALQIIITVPIGSTLAGVLLIVHSVFSGDTGEILPALLIEGAKTGLIMGSIVFFTSFPLNVLTFCLGGLITLRVQKTLTHFEGIFRNN